MQRSHMDVWYCCNYYVAGFGWCSVFPCCDQCSSSLWYPCFWDSALILIIYLRNALYMLNLKLSDGFFFSSYYALDGVDMHSLFLSFYLSDQSRTIEKSDYGEWSFAAGHFPCSIRAGEGSLFGRLGNLDMPSIQMAISLKSKSC